MLQVAGPLPEGTPVHNPDNALLLYVILLIIAFMFSARWQAVRDALTGVGRIAQNQANQ